MSAASRLDHELNFFALRLRLIRTVLGWNQAELADALGITKRATCQLESGLVMPRQKTRQAVEKLVGVLGLQIELSDNGRVVLTAPWLQLSEMIVSQQQDKKSRRSTRKPKAEPAPFHARSHG